MRTNRLLAVTVLSVLGVTGLTACNSGGGDDKKGDAAPAASAPASASAAASEPAAGGGLEKLTVAEITAKSRAAGAKLTSAKLVAKVTQEGTTMSASVAADSSGNCTGTIGIEGKGTADVRRTADKVWVKPDAEFFATVIPNGDTPAAQKLVGKWLASSKADDIANFAEFCDMALTMQTKIGLNDDGTPDNTGTKSGTKKVDGIDAILIVGKDDDGKPVDATIAAEGEPYLLTVDDEAVNSMKFSDFNEPVQVTAPAADQVIDLKSFGGAAKS
ncbi:hypothetical protein [Kitasatospora phosalacinea]|uniref:Lipoprotein n=1 Tax=Kitasatospora phosalacinea TaxID=2065 RepID=A0A9W6PFG2_9ACTN|nr:hypothetical protein [Kitasatospora phosalacinea]GLW54100.1 lipoprotein [Kitasatospora phosalacinea]